MISEDLRKKLIKKVEEAHSPQEALIDLIMGYQRERGWLNDESVREIARMAGVSPLQVEELATFYNLIFRRPVGRKVILICDSISCSMMGSDRILGHLKKRLDVTLGETTKDGLFTLLPICCLGHCGEAPSMLIGEKLHGNLTPEKIDRILEEEQRKMEPQKDS